MTTDARIGQLTVETVDGGTPLARIAQLTVEICDTQAAAEARVAQLWIEVFASPEAPVTARPRRVVAIIQ